MFCSKCGKPMNDTAVFCPHCGFKRPAQQPAQGAQQPHSPQPAAVQLPAQQPPVAQYAQTPPYGTPGQPTYEQPQQKKTGLILGLSLGGVALVAAIAAVIVFCVVIPRTKGATQPFTSATQQTTVPPQENTQAQTTEPPKEALPFEHDLGAIAATDFAWIADEMSGDLQGSFLSNNALCGKWKAEFVFDGVWELAYLTIDKKGTITVQPYQINYGEGWDDESGDAPYTFKGTFDVNRVFGSGIYGEMDLFRFLESGGTQYGVGTFTTQRGEQANVYLVRP